MTRAPLLSVIIPVYNEERRLGPCMEQVVPYLSEHYQNEHEIIIVDNASRDDTFMIAQCYANSYPNIYALRLPVKGKGIAIKKGMLFARGNYRFMCDVDLSTPIQFLRDFMKLRKQYDVVVGSRELMRGMVHTTLTRRVVGRVFHALVSDLVPGVQDTQCGYKLFSALAAEAIFSRLQITGFAFDVEALYLARLLDFPVGEMPVAWEHNADSRVSLVRDSLSMARDVITIPWLHMRERLPLRS